MKRKYLDRHDWERVIDRRYYEKYISTLDYTGYVSLLHIDEVTDPLIIEVNGHNKILADKGMKWLQFLPDEKKYAVSIMIDANKNVLQWYFDIIKESGLENGKVFFDDLYLDVVHLPNHMTILIDEDDLEEALSSGTINKADYDLAYKEANRLMNELKNGENHIVNNWMMYLNQLDLRVTCRQNLET